MVEEEEYRISDCESEKETSETRISESRNCDSALIITTLLGLQFEIRTSTFAIVDPFSFPFLLTALLGSQSAVRTSQFELRNPPLLCLSIGLPVSHSAIRNPQLPPRPLRLNVFVFDSK